MNQMKLQKIDESIAALLLLISFYELIGRLITSLGDCPLPTTYVHPIVNVFKEAHDNETIMILINKNIKTKIEKLINNSNIDRNKLVTEIEAQIVKLSKRVTSQTLKRNK